MRQSELILAVYLPTAMLAIAQGVLIVTLPLYADDLGVGYTMISIITAAASMGTLIMDVPAGVVLHRIGLRRTMLIGCALVVIGTMGLTFPMHANFVVALRVVAGIGTALWSLSRHSFIAQAVPTWKRGQAIAMFGGINRVGLFGGPIIGGVIATAMGMHASFFAAGLLGIVGWIAASVFIPAEESESLPRRGASDNRWRLVRKALRENGLDIGAAGAAQLFGQVIRQGRQLIIPLIGAKHLGLNAAEIGTVMTVSAILDMSMFVPAGYVMDRFGRKYASVPTFLIMGVGLGLLPFANSFGSLLAIGLLIGLGNGLGSGTMMTLGADLAPEGATGEFLGIWRLIGDIGMVLGPLLVGIIASTMSLRGSAYMLMAAGFAASAILAFLVRETRTVPESESDTARIQPT
ncbi:MAG TPA: MFS transporter [Thermomicrobiales bacterium]|nr:MFS transporter [Thermomicrobiales bacterium]